MNHSYDSLKKVGSKEQFLILIVLSVIVLGILSYYNQESTTPVLWYVQQDRVYDPLCLMADFDENSNPSHQGYCRDPGTKSAPMIGLSYYYETKYNYNDIRFLALKVKIPEIPSSTPFITTEIKSAKLQLHTRYDATKDDPFGTETFSIHHGLCDDISWNEGDTDKELTCVSDYKNIVSKINTFYGTLDANFIQIIDLDIASHIQYALFFEMDEYTETVRFYPLSVIKDRQIDSNVRNCLKNIEHISERRDCVERYQLHVFTKDYPQRFDLYPKLLLEYTQTPTALINSLHVVSLTLIPIFGTSMLYLRHQRLEHYSKMKTICSSLQKEIDDTYEVLKDNPTHGKLINSFPVSYDKNQPSLIIKFKEKFNNQILLHDTYDGVKNSGLLQNFQEKNLIEIITFYNQVKNYNLDLNRLYELKLKASFSINQQNVNELSYKYEIELRIIAKYLGKARKIILEKITDKNGIRKILSEEELRYS